MLDHVYIILFGLTWSPGNFLKGAAKAKHPCDTWSGLAQLPRNAVNQMLLLGPERITLAPCCHSATLDDARWRAGDKGGQVQDGGAGGPKTLLAKAKICSPLRNG